MIADDGKMDLFLHGEYGSAAALGVLPLFDPLQHGCIGDQLVNRKGLLIEWVGGVG